MPIPRLSPLRIQLGLLTLIALAFGVTSATQGQKTEAESADVKNEYLEHLRNTKGVVDIRLIHESDSGPNAFNLMVVSAGFTVEESEDFFNVCSTLSNSMFIKDPWKKYQDMVNIYGIHVDDESPEETRVQVTGWEGQVLGCQNKPAIEFANFAGKSDATIVVHNSNFSTATCGPWAMVTCHRGTASNYGTLHHELGHSVGGLGDTYTQREGAYDGSIPNLWEGKNASDQANPLLSPYHYWTQDLWQGPFNSLKTPDYSNVINVEGAAWATGFYRPEEKCLMRGGDAKRLCTVCSEVMESCLFRTINMFEEVSPPAGEVVLWQGESQTFDIKALKFIRDPRPWMESRLELHVNGRQVVSTRKGEVSFEFGGDMATPGYHQLGANLNVEADEVRRDDGFLGAHRAWRVKVMPYEKPRLSLPPIVTAQPNRPVRVPLQLAHSRRDLVEIQMHHAPDGATLGGGVFEWRSAKPGSWQVDFTVTMDDQEAFTESLTIHVDTSATAAGEIKIPAQDPVDTLVNQEATIQLVATSEKEGQLLYELLNPQDGMAIDRTTGALIWTPREHQYGPHRLQFRVSSGAASSEGHVLIGVCNESVPYLNSYLTTYNRDRNQWLVDHKDSPFIYHKIFEISRMFRERFSDIYLPALEEAREMFPELNPGMREAYLQEFARYAWSFVDRPAILEWLTEISANGTSPNSRKLQAEMAAIRLWRTVKNVELGGNANHLESLLAQMDKVEHPTVLSAIRRAVGSLYETSNDQEAYRRKVWESMTNNSNRELVGKLRMLPVIEIPKREQILLKVALDPDPEVSAQAIDAIDKVTENSTLEEVVSFSTIIAQSPDPRQRAVMSKILYAIIRHVNDTSQVQTALIEVINESNGPGRGHLLYHLPIIREPALMELLQKSRSSRDRELATAARNIYKHLEEEIGATDAFIASWQLSGPYLLEADGKTVFAPEKGEPAEWQAYECVQQSGPRIVPLRQIFEGDNRVAYMKVTVHSEVEQKVLFGAGSDDGIHVWLNGELIHENQVMRTVKPDEDQFTGILKAGRNEILCKIRQYDHAWGGCLSIRSEYGGPALGVKVVPSP